MSGTVASIQQRIESFASTNGMAYDAAVLYLADYGLLAMEQRSKAGKQRMKTVTPEQRQAFARSGAMARWNRQAKVEA